MVSGEGLFRRLAVVTALFAYLQITLGGVVRVSGSGLGCPDWPLCFGAWVPPLELHAWIEHSHRLVAALAVGPLVAAVGLITVFTPRRHDRLLLIAAVVAGVLVVVQAWLGGQVVIQQLRAELVTALAADSRTVVRGCILLAAYSFGITVAFVAIGIAFTRAMNAFRWVRDHYDWIRYASGGTLVVLGLLLFFNRDWWLRVLLNRALDAIGLGGRL